MSYLAERVTCWLSWETWAANGKRGESRPQTNQNNKSSKHFIEWHAQLSLKSSINKKTRRMATRNVFHLNRWISKKQFNEFKKKKTLNCGTGSKWQVRRLRPTSEDWRVVRLTPLQRGDGGATAAQVSATSLFLIYFILEFYGNRSSGVNLCKRS